ncbi:hypothetical protein EHQ47_11970 [Leptospira bourretii]|uniref:hypothetical protein n=1 Tax=Leptospira bourretii TaxID=2484962 RepID=UPI001091191F|nr:hypothetical protein [Leptospira bourretii]TGL21017.1 hypothetical protein EHQ47_11970 [Leptospira bourretii]
MLRTVFILFLLFANNCTAQAIPKFGFFAKKRLVAYDTVFNAKPSNQGIVPGTFVRVEETKIEQKQYWLRVLYEGNSKWLSFNKEELTELLKMKVTIENGSIIEGGHEVFNSNLYDLQLIGKIKSRNEKEYFVVSGKDCSDCDTSRSIYIHLPERGRLIANNGENRYKYPGKELSIDSDEVVYSSRAFLGEVLNNKLGVIWYEKRFYPDGNKSDSVFLVTFFNNEIVDQSIEKKLPNIQETIDLEKKGYCYEISGIVYREDP